MRSSFNISNDVSNQVSTSSQRSTTTRFVCVPLVSAMMLVSLQTVAGAAEPENISPVVSPNVAVDTSNVHTSVNNANTTGFDAIRVASTLEAPTVRVNDVIVNSANVNSANNSVNTPNTVVITDNGSVNDNNSINGSVNDNDSVNDVRPVDAQIPTSRVASVAVAEMNPVPVNQPVTNNTIVGNVATSTSSTNSSTGTSRAIARNTVITDIRFNGLNRITDDSLFAILPITVGDTITQPKLAQSINAIYSTGNFDNIQAHVNGNQLVFDVRERPIIAEVNFEGNKLIPIEGLREGLESANLAVGDTLKQATVQGVANELQQQYISQGYYNSDIEVVQTLLDGNRVKLDFRFIEGDPAKVVDINIIGNEYFDDKEIADVFAIRETSWNRWFSKSDRYAKEKLAASLENLKALYTNEGFIEFTVDDAILNISEDLQSVFIEISVTEGEQYQFGDVSFLGNPQYDTQTLLEDVAFEAGEQYSQRQLDYTTAALTRRYGNEGYYLAQIRPVTRIDEDTNTVNIDYYIDPSRPVYVRRINFSGNFKTADEVLRREMRQLESSLASNEDIQRSKARLMRTGYFKSVVANVRPVPNLPDQIDIDFVVEEQPSGTSTIAAGYSQSGGVTFQVDLSQRNFLGTGNKVNASLSRSETYDSYSLGYTDPYFTPNGVAQGISGYYKRTKYDDRNVSNYVTDSYGATLNYSYPIDERQRVSAGFNYDNTEVRGGRFMGISNVEQLLDNGGTLTEYTGNDAGRTTFKNDYDTYNLLLGWDYSTLDRPMFPTSGMSHSLDGVLGFGDTNFQKLIYRGNYYRPIYNDWIARGYAKLGYGNDLPFYENFYAGGYGSVRGYEQSSLGPRSTTFYDTTVPSSFLPEEVGGNALITFGTELIIPVPFKGDWTNQVRPVLFVEGGQVIDTTDRDERTFSYVNSAGVTIDTNEPLIRQDEDLRFSAGAGVTWYTPIGPISLSYSVPFNDKEGDETEEVQFQIGSTF